jgi:putative hydrolase of the HAD superfamily
VTRAVLFDATGTLIELVEPVGDTYARFAAGQGASRAARLEKAFRNAIRSAAPIDYRATPAAEVEARERAWWRRVVRTTFGAAAIQPRDSEGCFEALFAHFATAEAWRVREGADAALGWLREAGFRLAVVSNFDHRLPGLLEALGIARHFDAVALPSVQRIAKPEPGAFEATLRGLGVRAVDAAFVGDDRERDFAVARNLGMLVIDVTELATLADLPGRLSALGWATEENDA